MLDRTKLKRVGRKHIRAVIDEAYKEMLIGKLVMLGYRYRETEYREYIASPYDPPVSSRVVVMWRSKAIEKHWRIRTKDVHNILTYWSKEHE